MLLHLRHISKLSLYRKAWPRCHNRATGAFSVSQQCLLPIRARFITNATKPDYIPSLLDVSRVDAKPGGWHPTLVHSSGELKFTIIRLQPSGGEVPTHLHNQVWDYFMPLSGEAVIETKSKDGVKKEYGMLPGSFLAVPPKDIHRVRNTSDSEEFVFLIVQAPRHQYDFVAQ